MDESKEVLNQSISAMTTVTPPLAADETVPIFERLRFVANSARNLDAFFATRVGAMKHQDAPGVENLVKRRRRRVWTPTLTLRNVATEVERQVDAQAALLENHTVPALCEHDIRLEFGHTATWSCGHVAHFHTPAPGYGHGGNGGNGGNGGKPVSAAMSAAIFIDRHG